MSYLYDLWGWYAGEGDIARSTEIAPANTSQTTVVGEMRANWTGHSWVDLAYFMPFVLSAPREVPAEVTRRQAKQALLLAGVLGSVQGAIDAIPDATQRALAQIEWDDSQVFERNRPILIMLATALGLSSEQLDDLFITAAGL